MLISLRVFILRAAQDLHTSLKSSSGHTANDGSVNRWIFMWMESVEFVKRLIMVECY